MRQSHWVLHLSRKQFSRAYDIPIGGERWSTIGIEFRKVNEGDDQMIRAVGTMDGPDAL